MNIGSRIKQRRMELKMSADSLAKIIGKDRSTVYRYESGGIDKVSADILVTLANALETTPSYLIGLERSEEQAVASFLSADGVQLKHMETWLRELGHIEFTDAENREIVNFSERLISLIKCLSTVAPMPRRIADSVTAHLSATPIS